ncbi:MerR family transcriptional regulator [Nonlabens marinus]|uniref:Transcriptional regulator, MerR family n=1 Tax=Nonlabens marinus S1-08 TaxID=1454201 RepID=W8VZ83_9FLAO|nr:MerR family transcriptional regulator [Nonlabens marinus]BAO54126.1 transcriptional regulator, MerR family [Nonlabens marinus S1-08]
MIKTTFSIKDLENLSGIKAHTIRIWEKRYSLFTPERTDSNIRRYDTNALQRILNVSYLNNNGNKISAIAAMDDCQLEAEVKKHAEKGNTTNHSLQEIKLAMVNFDKNLFNRVFNTGLKELGFQGVFREILIPFLIELGHLWHSNTINVAHEHFISHLIKQKLLSHMEHVDYQPDEQHKELYILFLPQNEMHDLGLLFLNYELLSRGRETLYLGTYMTLEALEHFQNKGKKLVYITYITVDPTIKKVPKFLKQFEKNVNKNGNSDLWILGQMVAKMKDLKLNPTHKTFDSIEQLINGLETSKKLEH